MAKIVWDDVGKKIYETGVDHGVLYVQDEMGKYPKGVAWNGLTAVNESPSGGEPSPLYADNIKYLNLMSTEEYNATIEAYTYPEEFEACDGSAVLGTATGISVGQQSRKQFGFSYRTKIGNDVKGDELGYKIHLVYGALAKPTEKAYNTVNDSPEAITFSWEISTTPVPVTGMKPTASLTIDSTKVSSEAMKKIEDKIYGGTGEATLPTPDEIAALVQAAG